MTVTQSLLSFLLAAGLLTLTPGLDTALILRTATVEGPRQAMRAALGINVGLLLWGSGVAFGLGALLAASAPAFAALKWAGGAYLVWLGLHLALKRRARFAPVLDAPVPVRGGAGWFWKGMLGNLLNPKVGLFYLSFLPQFVPPGLPVTAFTLLLTSIHMALGLAWCATLVAATRPLARLLRRPAVVRTLDRLTGCLFIGFGARLALSHR